MPQIIDRFVPADLDATAWANIEPLFETLRTREISSGAEFDVWLVDRSELDASCSEAGARLYINMTCDTGDEEAASAYRAFQTGVVPKIRPVSFELDKRQAELADRFGMRAGRFEVIDRDTRADVELFRQENVPILTELSGLSQEYQTVAGAMSVEFRGEVKTLPQMAVHQESTDRAEREEAWRATADRRLEDREKIDGLYDRMVERRDRLAKNAGEPSYVGYAFRSMHRFDYTPDDCRTFHQAIEEVVMPFCAGLDSRRRERLGVDGLRPWDLAVDPKGRPPLRPFTNGADLVKRSRAVFGALDPELAGLFERLGDGSGADGIRGGQLLDLDSRRGKAPGGYQYMQDRTRRPFIFMNAAGVHRDVETMVHEAGHAFHSMLCEDEPLLHYRHSPIEFAEVASMAMELLSMPHWGAGGGFYENPEDLARAQRQQLENSLSLLPWIATIDAFQHWVYDNPGHSREGRTACWLSLVDRYGLQGHRVAWDDRTKPALDSRWQAQSHLFSNPFYYIEYGIAQLGALQLWQKSIDEGEAAALEAYKRALRLGGSRPLPELFEAAGIRLRFDADVLGPIRERVESALAALPE